MSGAKKNDQGKAALALIPYCAQLAEAEAFMVGQRKYGTWNFMKGMEASRLMSALLRHANAWFNGEERDPVDGQHHLGSVRACAAMIMAQVEQGTLIDDRYKPEIKKQPLTKEEEEQVDEFLTETSQYSELFDSIPGHPGVKMATYMVSFPVESVNLEKAETASACGKLQGTEEG